MLNQLQEKKYPLTNDPLFKAVFGQENEKSKYLLKELLNALLHLQGEQRIKELTHRNPFSIAESYTEKETIFDIKVVLENGDQVDIEMQVEAKQSYRKRSLFYWSKLHSKQPIKGQNYENTVKSICINIVNSRCIRESDDAHSVFRVLEDKKHFLLCDDLEIHYFQLPNLRGIIELSKAEIDEEAWLLFIRDVGRKTMDEINKLITSREVLKMAYDVYNKLNEDELMLEKLEAHEKYIMDRETGLAIAKREGREEGAKEKQIEIAKNLLDILDDQTIALKTGLTIEEVHKLR
ncbi:MAG: Rpn family recombination-promoting nuclease/putative transposase [Vallitaleaceae bacterium]|nr:Rpn family recombination-promoting nuclease/putative transposase [Vallitaleaceae bacterium]